MQCIYLKNLASLEFEEEEAMSGCNDVIAKVALVDSIQEEAEER